MSLLQKLSPVLACQLSWPVVVSTCAAGGILTGCLAAYYLRKIAVRPRLFGSQKITNFLTQHVPATQERFWPTWWAFNAILSTLARVVIQRVKPTHYRREILPLPDGGQVGLDWNEPDHLTASTSDAIPHVVILPGITGCSEDQYVKNTAAIASSKGYRAVVFNNRGQGGVSVTSPRAYCAANCEDLAEVVLHVQRQSPSSPIFIIGFSMGGMVSTHFFGQYCRDRAQSPSTRAPAGLPTRVAECNVVGGMGVSTCWDPAVARQSLESTMFNRALNRHICGNLHALVRRNAVGPYNDMLDKLGGMEHICQTEFISDFDKLCTAPAFGYTSLEEYYAAASPVRHLKDIDIPVLYINACDDMFMPGKALPYGDMSASMSVGMLVTAWGGHLGFVEGAFPRGDSYADRIFGEFLDAVFQHGGGLAAAKSS